ncbi:hypothetical protein AAFP35_04970 [Gordonia sp. CPCC 206044]|uniref:hypothetical protein n=1 Tax=Gordonia sp. CPCC 206044 TaxID=3140793 RepID=UPI003AF39B9C
MSRLDDVLELCQRGVSAESVGLFADAAAAYRNAWDAAEEPFEQCVAAYHLARTQSSADKRLEWSQSALDFALACDPGSVRDLLPTVQVAAAAAARDSGQSDTAQRWYREAAELVRNSPAHDGSALRAAIADGLSATAPTHPITDKLREFGYKREYHALNTLLPAYVASVIDGRDDSIARAAATLAQESGIAPDQERSLATAIAPESMQNPPTGGPGVDVGLRI